MKSLFRSLTGFSLKRQYTRVGLLFFMVLCTGCAFAQDESCDTCYETPSFIDDYVLVAYELQKKLPITTVCGNGDFLKGTEGLSLGALTQGLRANMTSYVTKVIGGDNRLGNVFGNYKMLGRSRAVMRDWNRLLKIDSQLSKIGCAVVKQQLFFEEPPLSFYTSIDDSLQKLTYIRLGTNDSGTFNMKRNGKNYGDMVLLLRQINQYYKKLYHDKFYTQELETVGTDEKRSYGLAKDERDDRQENEDLRNVLDSLGGVESRIYGTALRIDSDYDANKYVDVDTQKLFTLIRETEISYRCADGKTNLCSDGVKKIRDKNRELISDHTKHDWKHSLNTFKIATNRLMGLLVANDSKADKAAEERKEDLLTGFWGKRIPNEKRFEGLLKGPASSLSQFSTQLGKSFWQRSIDPMQDFRKNDSTSVEPSDASQKEGHNRKESKDYTKDEYKQEQTKKIVEEQEKKDKLIGGVDNQLQINQNKSLELDLQKTEIERVFSTYMKSRPDEILADLSHFNTKETTSAYAGVSIKIHKAANSFGDYDKPKKSINGTLLEMCTTQCEGLPQKSCRSDHL